MGHYFAKMDMLHGYIRTYLVTKFPLQIRLYYGILIQANKDGHFKI